MSGSVRRSRSVKGQGVLVLGMHRSGTSLTAGLLGAVGAEFGSPLFPANAGNPVGYFEHETLVACNDGVLAHFGLDWHSEAALPPLDEHAADTEVDVELRRIEAVLHEQLLSCRLWAVKDPRLCRLLPLWRSVLGEKASALRCLLVLRHPAEVAASLLVRDGFPAEKSHLLWLRHALEAEAHSRDLPRAFVRFDALLGEPRGELERLRRELRLRFPVSPARASEAIEELRRENLRRHTASSGERGLHPWVRSAYRALLQLERDPAASRPRATLDRIRRELERGAELFDVAARDRSTRLAQQLDSVGHDRSLVEGRLAESQAAARAQLVEVETGRREFEALQALLEDQRAERAQIAAALDALRGELAEREQRLAQERERAARSEGELAARREELERQSQGLTALRGEADGLRSEALGLRREVEALRGAAEAHRAGEQALADALEAERQQAAQIEQALLEGRRARNAAETRARSSEAREQGIARRLRASQVRLASLRARLEEAERAGQRLALSVGAAEGRAAGALQREAELVGRVSQLEADREEGERVLASAQHRIRDLEQEAGYYSAVVRSMERSRSWRVTAPLRFAFLPVRLGTERWRAWRPRIDRRRLRIGLSLIARGRIGELRQRMRAVARAAGAAEALRADERESRPGTSPAPPSEIDAYAAWREVNQPNARRAGWLGDRIREAGVLPSLSLVMPVYRPSLGLLERSLGSLREQLHGDRIDWELCAHDDGSGDPALRGFLEHAAASDARIQWRAAEGNEGIASATNTAAARARGDFLVFLDQGDELSPDALAEVALALAEHPDADLLYSDDDKIELDGRRHSPQFKPGWSPELLLAFSYTSHLLVIRRSLFEELGGMDPDFDGSQDYDLVLRAAERAREVVHVPRVLYHWRVEPGSTAASGGAKSRSIDAGRRAVQAALDRRGIDASAQQRDWARSADCGVFSNRFPDTGPSVSILIPSRNQPALLRRCIESIETHTRYRDYEIVVVDNESDDPATLAYLEGLTHRVIHISNPDAGFSFAAINNRAAEQVGSDFLLFLNDDTEVRTPEWLSQMVGWLQVEGVGAVGARLVFPDGRLQHAGVLHGLYDGMAGPAFKLQPEWDHGPMSLAAVTRNCAAVTAACCLVPRRLFLELGGFDEKAFAVAYNDVDFCYRLREAGGRVVVCAEAELIHHEGATRGNGDDPSEPATFRRLYGGEIDPYYNPNLSLDDERFAIAARTPAPASLAPIPSLHFSHNLAWEGASNSLFELVVALRDAGAIEPTVFSPEDGELRAAYEEVGIPVEVRPHPLGDVHNVEAYEQSTRDLAAWMRAGRFELVHANTLQTFYGVEAARLAALPSLWHVRESEDWRRYYDFLEPPLAQRAIDCFAHPYAVVFVARATRARFAELAGHHHFATLPNALDPERTARRIGGSSREQARQALGIDPERIGFLSLGTVCERKGQHDAVEAFAQLDPARHDAELWIVGDRPSAYSDALHARVRGLPDALRQRVRIAGETGEVAAWFAAADAFVFTSRLESHPRVILEAMSAGLGIVATPVFGVAEQVQEGVNALFYPPGHPEALAAHLAALASDESLRARLATNSQSVLQSLPSFPQMVSGAAVLFRGAWLSGASR